MRIKERFEEWWIASEFQASKNQIIAILILASIIGTIWLVNYFKQARPVAQIKVSKQAVNPKNTAKKILVHVGGAVKNPDVYELKEGQRAIDAIKLAGGFTKNADKDSLNLAAILKDAQQVLVLQKNRSETNQQVPDKSTVNLNTASEEKLKELPGIGEIMAQRITEYRKEKGSFSSINELKEIEGIGKKKFEKIKTKVTL